MKLTFGQQQELNRIRDGAMGKACEGLTTAELNELTPNLLKAVVTELVEARKALAKTEGETDGHQPT